MPYQVIENFKYGLDARRSEWTSQPGTLMTLENCHINTGGEIEKRQKFTQSLFGNGVITYGLEVISNGLVTFGSAVVNATEFDQLDSSLGLRYKMIGAVRCYYQQLVHPGDNTKIMSSIVCSTSFGGKAWAVAAFGTNSADGVFGYYDGAVINQLAAGTFLNGWTIASLQSWLIARINENENFTATNANLYDTFFTLTNTRIAISSAYGTDFSIIASSSNNNIVATKQYGSFIGNSGDPTKFAFKVNFGLTPTGGSLNKISSITVDDIQLLSPNPGDVEVVFDTSTTKTASNVATAINNYNSGFVASADSGVVTLSLPPSFGSRTKTFVGLNFDPTNPYVPRVTPTWDTPTTDTFYSQDVLDVLWCKTGTKWQVSIKNGTNFLPGGLVVATDYYMIRVNDHQFKLATSLVNANAGTAINITSIDTAGTFYMVRSLPALQVNCIDTLFLDDCACAMPAYNASYSVTKILAYDSEHPQGVDLLGEQAVVASVDQATWAQAVANRIAYLGLVHAHNYTAYADGVENKIRISRLSWTNTATDFRIEFYTNTNNIYPTDASVGGGLCVGIRYSNLLMQSVTSSPYIITSQTTTAVVPNGADTYTWALDSKISPNPIGNSSGYTFVNPSSASTTIKSGALTANQTEQLYYQLTITKDSKTQTCHGGVCEWRNVSGSDTAEGQVMVLPYNTGYVFTDGVNVSSGWGAKWIVDLTGTWNVGDTYNFDLVLSTGEIISLGVGGNVDNLLPTSLLPLKNRLYYTKNNRFIFSANGNSTLFETQNQLDGAGYIEVNDMPTDSGMLTFVSSYQGRLAVGARKAIQLWTIDGNPTGFSQVNNQPIDNIGTFAPLSVKGLGDLDLLMLYDSGVRSLRVRDSSLNAITVDIGTPIDAIVQAQLATLSEAEKTRACAVVDPSSNRYWLFVPGHDDGLTGGTERALAAGIVYVLTYYPNNKIIAWATYKPTYSNSGIQTPFAPQKFVTYSGTIFCRDASAVYTYGGGYDSAVPKVQLPWSDGKKPGHLKKARSVDIALTGAWKIYGSMNYNVTDLTTLTPIYSGSSTSFMKGNIPFNSEGTHYSLLFVGDESGSDHGPKVLSSVLFHFTSENEK